MDFSTKVSLTIYLLQFLALAFGILPVSSKDESHELQDHDRYDETTPELVEGTAEFCMFQYPYTYSKCLYLCHENLDPACMADSLCVCDLNVSQEAENGTATLLHSDTNCLKTAYCDISCREKSLKNQYFTKGHLCDRSSKSVCICFM